MRHLSKFISSWENCMQMKISFISKSLLLQVSLKKSFYSFITLMLQSIAPLEFGSSDIAEALIQYNTYENANSFKVEN